MNKEYLGFANAWKAKPELLMIAEEEGCVIELTRVVGDVVYVFDCDELGFYFLVEDC